MAHFALRRLCPIFDLCKELGLDPYSPMRDLLAVGLCLTDQWLEPRLQVLGRCAVKAVVDLARIDQLFALAPGEIDAGPFFAVERETGDGQRLTLGTGLFHPIVDATRDIPAVAHLRDDALKASLAGMLVHLGTIDLEAIAELDIGLGYDLLE